MLFPTYAIAFLNIAVIFVLALYTFSGYRNGFLLKVISCFSIAVLCIIAWLTSPYISEVVNIFPKEFTPMIGTVVEPAFYSLMNRLSVFAIMFIIFVVLTVLIKPIVKAIGLVPLVNEVNKLLGLIFGFFQGLIIVGIVAFIFSTPLFANGNLVVKNSFLKPA
ncbi:MAG: CvpA family protein, partial [Erysipelotrichaceae bacterium]